MQGLLRARVSHLCGSVSAGLLLFRSQWHLSIPQPLGSDLMVLAPELGLLSLVAARTLGAKPHLTC